MESTFEEEVLQQPVAASGEPQDEVTEESDELAFEDEEAEETEDLEEGDEEAEGVELDEEKEEA